MRMTNNQLVENRRMGSDKRCEMCDEGGEEDEEGQQYYVREPYTYVRNP